VLVGQALRDGTDTKEKIDAFVAQLRAGEAQFPDESSEGRTRSLGASLGYGFEHAFTDAERKQLALLHLFQGFVNVDVLRVMGNPDADWCLPEVRGLTREAGIALLDRAAEVGLLTPLGGGYYTIHPAVPWFFKSLFDSNYAGQPAPPPGDPPGQAIPHALRPVRAFVNAIGALGDFYTKEYTEGRVNVISALAAEEANLIHARHLARKNGWWQGVASSMQGLRALYEHTGRRAEWKALVDEIVPDFVDPDTDGPIPGREEDWSLVTEYRVDLARAMRDWAEAERLQTVCVEWNRRRAEEIVQRRLDGTDQATALGDAGAPGPDHPASSPGPPRAFRDRLAAALPGLTGGERNEIRTLASSLHGLGDIQSDRGESGCVASYEEALDLAEQIGDRAGAAACAINLGNAYKNLSGLRDLDQAERWHRRGLELRDEHDRLGPARSHGQLGLVAYERFKEARAAGKPEAEQREHLNAALARYRTALDLTPADAVNDLAIGHNQLGNIYADTGDLDRALTHYRESIRFREASVNTYGAAQTRFNVALALARSGRFSDALEYARAALTGFSSLGRGAADMVQETNGLIERIEKDFAVQQQRR
jgi:tetratricopeptide (TPR) repeat protein